MSFFRQVYELVRQIPAGKVSTYGSIAKILGSRDARKVGWALHANSDNTRVPCHRVVKKDGRVSNGFAFGGSGAQRQLLEAEGVVFENGKVRLEDHLYVFERR